MFCAKCGVTGGESRSLGGPGGARQAWRAIGSGLYGDEASDGVIGSPAAGVAPYEGRLARPPAVGF